MAVGLRALRMGVPGRVGTGMSVSSLVGRAIGAASAAAVTGHGIGGVRGHARTTGQARRLSASPAQRTELPIEKSPQLTVSIHRPAAVIWRLVASSAIAITPTMAMADRAWKKADRNDSMIPRRIVLSLASAQGEITALPWPGPAACTRRK